MKVLIALVLAVSLHATSVLSISPADVTVSGGSVVDFTIAVFGTPGLVNCATAVNSNGDESVYSTEASAIIPTP